MRIRKRQALFPLPSLSPVPFSDPHLINPSPVVQLNDAAPPATTVAHMDQPRPSDQLLPPIGKPSNQLDDSSGVGIAIASKGGVQEQQNKQYCLVSEVQGQTKGQGEPVIAIILQVDHGRGGEKGNDTGKGSILGSETAAEVQSTSSPSNQDGRWCEGEKAIPLKKRRGSFERTRAEDVMENNKKKKKARMKTKMNKKCSKHNDNEQDEDDEEEEGEEREAVGKKRGRGRGRGRRVMEGSRCSRVNGRGWRCCQQTLVGYSLCEHHLGKGRLRSMTSVRTRSVAGNAPQKNEAQPLSGVSTTWSSEKQTDEGEDEDEKKPLIITKKRKLGTVKARSISSLLGQTITVADQNNK